MFVHSLDSQTYQLDIPVERTNTRTTLRIAAQVEQPTQGELRLGRLVQKLQFNDRQPVQATIAILISPKETYRIIQNAGLLLLPRGAGRDRGARVSSEGKTYYVRDRGQWDRAEQVFGACGAAAVFRRQAIQRVGGLFDPWYFSYYEDLDLSWRLRLRGHKIVYVPSAQVRHIHCGTSMEWSPFFVYYTKRNQLATVLRNGWGRLVARSWIWSLATLIHTPSQRTVAIRAWQDLLSHIPSLLRARQRCRRRRAHGSDEEIALWMEKGLLESEG